MEAGNYLNTILSQNSIPQTDYIVTIFNFILCVVMSFILRSFYIRRSFSLTGKKHIGSIIPILATVVFLVIMVVKSSLALSLGLVGALSIVRFRTPIKEPEELVYLFLAIALGLGYAAGQTMLTSLIFVSILIMRFFWLSNTHIGNTSEYNLVIQWNNKQVGFERIKDLLSSSFDSIKLIRLEQSSNSNTAVLLISPMKSTQIDNITKDLIGLDKDLTLSFYEAKANF